MELDLAALQHNFRRVREISGVPVMAIVKADAYGHGAVPSALALAEAGASHFAVATVEELTELRAAGICGPILVLGFVAKRDYPQLLYDEGHTAVYSREQAEILSDVASRSGCLAAVHIKIDSGMSRIGFPCTQQAAEDIAAIAQLPALRLAGVFSHLACADQLDDPYNQRQLAAFSAMVERCRALGVDFPLVHMANSAAALRLPEARFDMVRAGLALYGADPDPRLAPLGLKPVMTVKARLIRVFSIPAGTGVSYGCTWKAERDSVIATLPLGYADGVPRLLSNRGQVLLHGRRVNMVGRVCMDQLMLDVTDVARSEPVKVGDVAVLIGQQGQDTISSEELAAHAETINYELFCHFGQRLPRNYRAVKSE